MFTLNQYRPFVLWCMQMMKTLHLVKLFRPDYIQGDFPRNKFNSVSRSVRRLPYGIKSTDDIHKFLHDKTFIVRSGRLDPNWRFGFTKMDTDEIYCSDCSVSTKLSQVSFADIETIRWFNNNPDRRNNPADTNLSGVAIVTPALMPTNTDIDPMLIQKLREIGTSPEEINKLEETILNPGLLQVSMFSLSFHNNKSPDCVCSTVCQDCDHRGTIHRTLRATE